jgi:hypothetical protein
MKSITLLLLLSLLPTLIFSQEKKISKRQVPKVVLKAFHDGYPNAKVKQYIKEVDKGTTYYEVETTEGKTRRNVLYTPDGTVAVVEELISENNLPDQVKEAVKQNYAGSKIQRIEKATKGTDTKYEILFLKKKKKMEVVFTPSGNVIKD